MNKTTRSGLPGFFSKSAGIYLPAPAMLVVAAVVRDKALHVLGGIVEKQTDLVRKFAVAHSLGKPREHSFKPAVRIISLGFQHSRGLGLAQSRIQLFLVVNKQYTARFAEMQHANFQSSLGRAEVEIRR